MELLLPFITSYLGPRCFGIKHAYEGEVRMKRHLTIAIFLMALSPVVIAQDLATGSDDIQALREMASRGDAKAQHNLGNRYRLGHGVPKNPTEAVRWYEKAAEQGLPDAQYNLAVSYRRGVGVKKDSLLAVRWYTAAAELGHPQAQGTLGVMYINAEGVGADYEKAARWFTLAAKQNEIQAQYFLGNMYITGNGVPRDPNKAYFWLSVAAAQGADQASPKLRQLEKDMSKEQLARARKELADLGL